MDPRPRGFGSLVLPPAVSYLSSRSGKTPFKPRYDLRDINKLTNSKYIPVQLTGSCTTKDHTLVRQASICCGDTVFDDDFDPADESSPVSYNGTGDFVLALFNWFSRSKGQGIAYPRELRHR